MTPPIWPRQRALSSQRFRNAPQTLSGRSCWRAPEAHNAVQDAHQNVRLTFAKALPTSEIYAVGDFRELPLVDIQMIGFILVDIRLLYTTYVLFTASAGILPNYNFRSSYSEEDVRRVLLLSLQNTAIPGVPTMRTSHSMCLPRTISKPHGWYKIACEYAFHSSKPQCRSMGVCNSYHLLTTLNVVVSLQPTARSADS